MELFEPGDDYESCRARFHWDLPARFNIGSACADRPAKTRPDALAVLELDGENRHRLTFAELSRASSAFASMLAARGVAAGDRIAILLPQGRAVAIAHLAAYKLGAIAVPLAHAFRAEALDFRLSDAGIAVLVTDAAGLDKIAGLRAERDYPALQLTISVDPAIDSLDFWTLIAAGDPAFPALDTPLDAPCLMIYTSGTTGQPKGTLHGMRVLLGHLPGFAFHHQPFDRQDALFWTPADWAWAGGLLNLLLPALFYGRGVLAWPYRKFDPVAAYRLMDEERVTHAFLPPTALRMMRGAGRPEGLSLRLESLACAGEALGAETLLWSERDLGVPADEFFGQTECNYVLGSSVRRGVSRAGSTGKPLPGASVVLLDADGEPVGPGVEGEIAIGRDHPSMFLEYWNNPDATAAKFQGNWMRTGDRAVMDADGYIAFLARNDDIITSAGYRIGPVEIEDCLLKHPAVALAAAIGKPDPLRTEIVKAFLVLKPGFKPSDVLVAEIQDFVRQRLSVYEYPREIVFVTDLPMTSTGKIMRRLLKAQAEQPPGRLAQSDDSGQLAHRNTG